MENLSLTNNLKYIVTINVFKIVLFLSTFSVFSQNNGGFENWTTVGTYQDPDQWQTFNFLVPFGNPVSATRVSGVDKYSGNYALKITSVYFPNKLIPQWPDTFGITFNGKITIAPPAYSIGYPYTSRPTKLGFYAKYIPVGVDTGYAECTLFKRRPTKRDTIAIGYVKVLASGAYTFHQITLNYRSTDFPDSAHIYFKPCNLDSNARRVGSAIYVDDVAFIGALGFNEYQDNSQTVKVFPNPATDYLTISTQISKTEKIEIIDIFGKLLMVGQLCDSEVNFNTSSLEAGCYFYKVLDDQNGLLANGKIIIAK